LLLINLRIVRGFVVFINSISILARYAIAINGLVFVITILSVCQSHIIVVNVVVLGLFPQLFSHPFIIHLVFIFDS